MDKPVIVHSFQLIALEINFLLYKQILFPLKATWTLKFQLGMHFKINVIKKR